MGHARGVVHATFVGVVLVTALAGTAQTTLIVIVAYGSGYLAGARRGVRLGPVMSRARLAARTLSGRPDGGKA